MSCYISSNNNRLYVASESTYGTVPDITGANRIPTVKLTAKQVPDQTGRRDKTGSRTFVGLPNRIRKNSSFHLTTFMTEWTDHTVPPTHGPLFEAAMGAIPVFFNGGTVASVTGETEIQFSAPHGLAAGQGLTFSGEIRFVAAVANSTTVFVNAAFSTTPIAGSTMGTTVTFNVSTDLGSASIFDYWDPSSAVQRILNGAAMDTMKIVVNGDYQEFQFSGPSQDLLDSASFSTAGKAVLPAFRRSRRMWDSTTPLFRGTWARSGWGHRQTSFSR